jgi:hypothetical protein
MSRKYEVNHANGFLSIEIWTPPLPHKGRHSIHSQIHFPNCTEKNGKQQKHSRGQFRKKTQHLRNSVSIFRAAKTALNSFTIRFS